MAGDYVTAMDIAKKQVEDGAHDIDINVDDGMLDVGRWTVCRRCKNS